LYRDYRFHYIAAKEAPMTKTRIATVLIVAVLVAGLALTARPAFDTTRIVSAAREATPTSACAFSDWDRHNISAVYLPEASAWFPYTGADFTGRDGGLLSLRDCR
jgi:hypothetical protein